MVIYVSRLQWACDRFGPVAEMDRVLTPKQQCILLFFLKLPVDHVSDVDTLDNGLLLKTKMPIRDLTNELDTVLHLKTTGPIRDLITELESRSNVEPSDILG